MARSSDPVQTVCNERPNDTMTDKATAVILISGSGTNLQAIIDATAQGELPLDIKLVICNRPAVQGLQRAQRAQIPTQLIDHQDYAERALFDQALAEAIDASGAQYIILAGFMRILGDTFMHRFTGRMINLHPSLLPKYPGLKTYQRALAAGDQEHGASIHFVTNELDGGPIIAQAHIPILPDDDEQSLQQRLAPVEHRLIVAAVHSWVTGRVTYSKGLALLDGQPLRQPMVLNDDNKLAPAANCSGSTVSTAV